MPPSRLRKKALKIATGSNPACDCSTNVEHSSSTKATEAARTALGKSKILPRESF